jgi:hypothetical protein
MKPSVKHTKTLLIENHRFVLNYKLKIIKVLETQASIEVQRDGQVLWVLIRGASV